MHVWMQGMRNIFRPRTPGTFGDRLSQKVEAAVVAMTGDGRFQARTVPTTRFAESALTIFYLAFWESRCFLTKASSSAFLVL